MSFLPNVVLWGENPFFKTAVVCAGRTRGWVEPGDARVSRANVVPWAGSWGESRQCRQAARGATASPGCRPPRCSGPKAATLLEVEAGTLGAMKFERTNTGGEP